MPAFDARPRGPRATTARWSSSSGRIRDRSSTTTSPASWCGAAHAAYLISEQPWDFAFGRGSALERFVELDGKILLIGCDHDNVTFLHYAEHILDVPGMRIATFEVPVLENGERVWKEMKEVDTSGAGAHPNWPDRFFAQIVNGATVARRRTAAAASARALLPVRREGPARPRARRDATCACPRDSPLGRAANFSRPLSVKAITKNIWVIGAMPPTATKTPNALCTGR